MHTNRAIGESSKPLMIEDYNHSKGGVDTFDQMCSQYSCSRKTKRWPLCVFYGMINAAVINAYIIHCEKNIANKLERKVFMQSLALELAKPWAVLRMAVTTLPRQVKDQICQVYGLPSYAAQRALNAAADMREPIVRCVECGSKKDKKTRYRCVACNRAVCPSHFYTVCGNCV